VVAVRVEHDNTVERRQFVEVERRLGAAASSTGSR
jgi:hypothetical protein